MIHPGVKGAALPKDRWAETWNMLVSISEYNGKKLAYVHIPFCSTRCLYCGFFQNYTNREIEDAYIDRLIEDFKMSSRSLFIVSRPFHTVYIGGGTPSDMSVRNIKRLLLAINECLPLADDVTPLIRCGIDGGDLYQLNVYSDSKLNDAIAKGNTPLAAKTSEQAVMFKRG